MWCYESVFLAFSRVISRSCIDKQQQRLGTAGGCTFVGQYFLCTASLCATYTEISTDNIQWKRDVCIVFRFALAGRWKRRVIERGYVVDFESWRHSGRQRSFADGNVERNNEWQHTSWSQQCDGDRGRSNGGVNEGSECSERLGKYVNYDTIM